MTLCCNRSHRASPAVGKLAAVLGTALLLAAATAVTGHANPIMAWGFDDAPPAGWGTGTPYWEWMGYFSQEGSFQDLDPNNPYYACTEMMTLDWSNSHMGTRIWFANNYGSQNTVVIQLRRGAWNNEGSLLASDTVIVNNMMPAQAYDSDFGVVPHLDLVDESFVVKIIYFGPLGDTHVYWDDPTYYSFLWADPSTAAQPTTWGRIKALYQDW
jgi:hypothetical protein